MLRSLAIRDVVLIDRLDLTFHDGLSVLTGETGAGKSILLDALGLALGARAESGLLRHGADQATVSAAFELDRDHPAWAVLSEQGLDGDANGDGDGDGDGGLVLRRVLGRDGRGRAFVNDQPASVGLLRRLGAILIEIEGQFAEQGLLDTRTHRATLDAFAGLEAEAARTAAAHRAWRAAEAALAEAQATLDAQESEEEDLRHALGEIDALDPQVGEEEELGAERTVLMHREQLIEAMNAAAAALGGGGPAAGAPAGAGRGVEDALRAAQRALEAVGDKASGRFDEIIRGLDRAAIEAAEAEGALRSLGTTLDLDSNRLDEVEERLFAMRAVARKHGVGVDALAELRARLAERLAACEGRGEEVARLAADAAAARESYREAAGRLGRGRKQAAAALDEAVAGELPPLKLEKATFHTRVRPLDEADWSEHGTERVVFEVATTPGTPPGPLARIASGGELARFLLALKVVVAGKGPAQTLIFDEVDRGIGGAAAAAVGERLARLGRSVQVLVVTHSPQVAARGDHHWRVVKKGRGGGVATAAEELAAAARREEIARMLSGARITEAARAAADSLLKGDTALERTA